jgi:hypothetical protein
MIDKPAAKTHREQDRDPPDRLDGPLQQANDLSVDFPFNHIGTPS